MRLEPNTGSENPFNWIATVPLPLKQHPTINIRINGELTTHDTNNTFFETNIQSTNLTQTYTMGLILSDTANTPVFHTPLACAEQSAGILAKRQMRLEMLLNTKFTWQPDTCMTLYNELRACDEGLLKYDAGAKRDKSMVCFSSLAKTYFI